MTQKYWYRPLFGILKRAGPTWLKSRIVDFENMQFGEYLHEFDASYRSRINDWIEQYVDGGAILDLGCSDGHVGFSLDPRCYSHYTGVDLSTVAIARAQKMHSDFNKTKNRFLKGEIYSYKPEECYKVILFKDSIYYTSNYVILRCLKRLSKNLDSSGVFVVHMDNIHRHERIRQLIRKNFNVLEETNRLDPSGILIVFR